MVDGDKMQRLIQQLREYTSLLQQIVQQDRETFLSDPMSIGSARYYLQVSIETCLALPTTSSLPDGFGRPRTTRTASQF